MNIHFICIFTFKTEKKASWQKTTLKRENVNKDYQKNTKQIDIFDLVGLKEISIIYFAFEKLVDILKFLLMVVQQKFYFGCQTFAHMDLTVA